MIRNRVSLLAPMSFLLALGLGVVANAQYLISTKAGFVNRVEGEVYILRADGEDGEKGRASLGTQMRAGDRLSVAANGFAEALLNPGSYLRLSENTEIRAVNIDFDSVRFELIKGSVIVEIGQIDKKTPIEIVTPHGALTIAKAGLSRIDAKGSATLVAVRQGEIHLGTRDDFMTNQSLKIKRGKVVTLTGSAQPGPSDIAKLDTGRDRQIRHLELQSRAGAHRGQRQGAEPVGSPDCGLVLRPVLQLLHLRPVPLVVLVALRVRVLQQLPRLPLLHPLLQWRQLSRPGRERKRRASLAACGVRQ